MTKDETILEKAKNIFREGNPDSLEKGKEYLKKYPVIETDELFVHFLAANDNGECIDGLSASTMGGLPLNTKDNAGDTPLHYAAMTNSLKAAEALLKHGAKVNAANRKGETPLHYAATTSREMIELLIQFKADIFRVDENWKAPIKYAPKEFRVAFKKGLDIYLN